MSGGRRVKIKECNRVSKTRTALKMVNNKASPIKNRIEAPVAKMLKKVIQKNKVLKDKSKGTRILPQGAKNWRKGVF